MIDSIDSVHKTCNDYQLTATVAHSSCYFFPPFGCNPVPLGNKVGGG